MFVKKITNKLSLMFINFAFFTCLFSSHLHAHEMWIEPFDYAIESGEGILAHESIGQNFKGNTYAYLENSFESLNISVNDTVIKVKSRLGDLPAIQEKTNQDGLHIISAITTPSVISYSSFEKFKSFLKNEGLDWVLSAHKKRKLPEKDFTEVYRRNPKTLVKVGHGRGQDKPLGLQFEWVAETNPYTNQGESVHAQLLWMGKPAANVHVNIFNKKNHKTPSSEVIKTSLKTDAEGRVEIPKARGGLFLINAVKMIEPSADIVKRSDAVWESIWASLSYEILLNI